MQGIYEARVDSLMKVLQEKEDKVRGGLFKTDYVNPKGNIWAVFGSSFTPRLRRVVFMVYFASIKAGSQNWDDFCSMFIDAWADARKPKTRLNTTLKILAPAFGVDLIECLNKADSHIRMEESHDLRNRIKSSVRVMRSCLSKVRMHHRLHLKKTKTSDWHLRLSQHNLDICAAKHKAIQKIQNILICKAIPCVAHIFNKLFHDYKGFNNAFVFHLINNIAPQREETTEKALN